MKYLKQYWQFRTTILFLVSTAICFLLVMLEYTDWAAQINALGNGHEEGAENDIPIVLMYILPFVKELLFIGIPMVFVLLVLKLSSKFKKYFGK